MESHEDFANKTNELNFSTESDTAPEQPEETDNGSESVEDLKQVLAARADQLKAKTQEAQELQDKLLRLAAEFENFKKITQRDQQEFSRYANENLLRELLPIVDNLERAIGCGKERHKSDGLLQGVELTLKQFVEMLARFGVRPVTSVGERFDPTRHQAVAQVNAAEKPENTVVDEYQKGYQIHDRILRAAMVTVATASSGTPESSEASSQKPEGRPVTGSQDTPGENPNP